MPTYFDQNLNQTQPLVSNTQLYFICDHLDIENEENNTYRILGCSEGSEILWSSVRDIMQLEYYWTINTNEILSLLDNEILFTNEHLKKTSLSFNDLLQCLNFNPLHNMVRVYGLNPATDWGTSEAYDRGTSVTSRPPVSFFNPSESSSSDPSTQEDHTFASLR